MIQGAAPVTALYLPAAHAVHDKLSGPVCPRLQVQLVTAVLQAIEFEDAGHAVHAVSAVAPVAVLYVQTPQSVHSAGPISGLYLPAALSLLSPVAPLLHRQFAMSVLPGDELDSA